MYPLHYYQNYKLSCIKIMRLRRSRHIIYWLLITFILFGLREEALPTQYALAFFAMQLQVRGGYVYNFMGIIL